MVENGFPVKSVIVLLNYMYADNLIMMLLSWFCFLELLHFCFVNFFFNFFYIYIFSEVVIVEGQERRSLKRNRNLWAAGFMIVHHT